MSTTTYQQHVDRLLSTARKFEFEMEAKKQSIGYHSDQLMKERHDLEVLQKMHETMIETAESLRLLDKAGITLKKPADVGVTTIMTGERSATPRGRLG